MFHTNFHIKCVNYNVGHARELEQGIHFVKSPLAMQEEPDFTLPMEVDKMKVKVSIPKQQKEHSMEE